jgi:ribulose-phosphate 3-epimerase
MRGANQMYKLGIDIGGTKVNIGLLDQNNNIFFKSANLIPKNSDYKFVMAFIKSVLVENNIDFSQIQSCGIGVPGTVSSDGRIAMKIPNLNWENAKCAEEFETLTTIPTKLVQDSRAGALGEYLVGGGQGSQLLVCITLGTGIGVGIVKDGEIWNGVLGSAGELGHIPVVQNGRPCGCGKKGCLENYVAGKGLAVSANEKMPQYNNKLTGLDVFNMAKNGDEIAKQIIDNAICLLGNAVISIINVLSPDRILFSGGMSGQKELFVNPLMQYINENSYTVSVGEGFYMGYAKLGEDAPMVGAALLPQDKPKRQAKLSASIMCADIMNLKSEIQKLEQANIEFIHWDIMDGHFVPNLMLPIEMVNKVRSQTNLPFDIHLMVEQPEKYINLIDLRKDDYVSVHYESTPHVQRAISIIKEKGAKAALAINPATPIESCRELLEDIEMILIMSVNPGYAGQQIVKSSFDKIRRMRAYLDDLGYAHITIEVDGNCSFENVPKLYNAGAELFVVGSSSVFDAKYSIIEATEKLKNNL